MKATETIVAFHIGRGGRFNNAGHLSFIGEHNINEYVGNLFISEDNDGVYLDFSGNEVGLSVDNDGTGRINIDYDYDTTYCLFLSDCDFKEIKSIKNSSEWNKEYLIDSFLKDGGYSSYNEYEALN